MRETNEVVEARVGLSDYGHGNIVMLVVRTNTVGSHERTDDEEGDGGGPGVGLMAEVVIMVMAVTVTIGNVSRQNKHRSLPGHAKGQTCRGMIPEAQVWGWWKR